MTDASETIERWLQRQLQAMAEDLEEGLDVSPARRGRLEGALECWLRQGGEVERLRQWLDQAAMEAELEAPEVRLQPVMRRAPVWPGTGS